MLKCGRLVRNPDYASSPLAIRLLRGYSARREKLVAAASISLASSPAAAIAAGTQPRRTFGPRSLDLNLDLDLERVLLRCRTRGHTQI